MENLAEYKKVVRKKKSYSIETKCFCKSFGNLISNLRSKRDMNEI